MKGEGEGEGAHVSVAHRSLAPAVGRVANGIEPSVHEAIATWYVVQAV